MLWPKSFCQPQRGAPSRQPQTTAIPIMQFPFGKTRPPRPDRSGSEERSSHRSALTLACVTLAFIAAASGLAAVAINQTVSPSSPTIRVAALPTEPGAATLVDLNRATLPELEALPRIGPAIARKIVAARQDRPLRSFAELIAHGLLRADDAIELRRVAAIYQDRTAE